MLCLYVEVWEEDQVTFNECSYALHVKVMYMSLFCRAH